MTRSTTEIEDQIKRIEDQIATLGPALKGTLKHNKNRRVRKDGSVHTSKTYHTFTFVGANGKQAWKRINETQLPAIQKMIQNGKKQIQLAREHQRLATELALVTLKKNDASQSQHS